MATNYMVVFGSVTPKQYDPIRLQYVRTGKKIKVLRVTEQAVRKFFDVQKKLDKLRLDYVLDYMTNQVIGIEEKDRILASVISASCYVRGRFRPTPAPRQFGSLIIHDAIEKDMSISGCDHYTNNQEGEYSSCIFEEFRWNAIEGRLDYDNSFGNRNFYYNVAVTEDGKYFDLGDPDKAQIISRI